MESTGVPGAVHCTAATVAALGLAAPDVLDCFERRVVDVKGLGPTDTCLVHAATPQATALLAALPGGADATTMLRSASRAWLHSLPEAPTILRSASRAWLWDAAEAEDEDLDG